MVVVTLTLYSSTLLGPFESNKKKDIKPKMTKNCTKNGEMKLRAHATVDYNLKEWILLYLEMDRNLRIDNNSEIDKDPKMDHNIKVD